MSEHKDPNGIEEVLAVIENSANPDQAVEIKYLRDENAFVTSGIQEYFGEREILIPIHLAAADFPLVGAIVSSVLEKLSQALEKDSTFDYAPTFEVLDKTYSFAQDGEYVRLSLAS